MNITETLLNGCYVIEPAVYTDERGLFYESYQKKRFDEKIGLPIEFIQDNHSESRKGTLRGLHFQKGEYAQSKLVRVVKGAVLDVVVDLRKNSETFGEHFKVKLSDKNRKSLFIPKGMAHGFLALEDETIFTYKCDNYYNKESESGVVFNDLDLNIDWEYNENEMIISPKDLVLPTFKSLLV